MSAADVIVIGGGPAGMSAATRLARAGAAVVLLDDNPVPGGQVYRAPTAGALARGVAPSKDGERLRAELAASGAVVVPEARVWAVERGFRVDMVVGEVSRTVTAPRLLVAAGATERHVPFPGWTLPGVFGLAGATILMKSHGLAPGRRVVIAGAGPLLALVGAGLVAKGVVVEAIVDTARKAEWLGEVPAFASRPDLLATGLGWLLGLARARVPWLYGHAVIAAQGERSLETVMIAPLGRDGAPDVSRAKVLTCDALAIGHGLVPNTELIRCLGALTRWRPELGGFVPDLSSEGETSVPGLFVAGDGAGVSGAAAAVEHGRHVAEAILEQLGRTTGKRRGATERAWRRAARFGQASARLTEPRSALYRAIPQACIVCRCEDVTRAEIEAAITDGARDVNQLKAFTRAGMGPCQGKSCGEAIAELVAARVGSRTAAGEMTARPPFRPIDTAALVGVFDYADIPIPPPAPL